MNPEKLHLKNQICLVASIMLAIIFWVWILYWIVPVVKDILLGELEKETWYPEENDVGATEEFEEMLKKEILFPMIQGNSLVEIVEPVYLKEVGRVYGTVTAYTNRVEETDSTPNITASGKQVKEGYIACPRYLPFGTKVEIDNKIYECQDVMSVRYPHRFDIFFFDLEKALKFGKQEKEIILYK